MRAEIVMGALAGALLAVPIAVAAQPTLERVVMVSRHGVRSPTQSPQALKAATGLDWPTWPVAPGELTPHGAQDLSLMGGFLRQVSAQKGLLGSRGCPDAGAVQLWADGADSRTRESGQVLADALAPGCSVRAAHGADGAPDPLFDGACSVPAEGAIAALDAETDDGRAIVRPREARALQALQAVLAPDACRTGKGGPCLQGPSVFVAGKKGAKLSGPIADGATPAENLLLEYTQGMPADQVGWGRAGSAAAIASVIPVHERSAELLRRTPYIAERRGAVMARTVLDLLQGAAPTDPHAPPLSAAARMTMIAGHDTNLSNMAGVFGLDWTLPDQPDSTAPDTVLAFELWRDVGSGAATVRIVAFSQSLDQLREATPLDAAHPAGVTPVTSSLCASAGACRLDALVKAAEARLPQTCVGDTQ